MANNIRGITIEIGGDTTKLGKALENSEKKSRSLQTELRQIQQSLKFNPSNVELLNQKQTVLTQSIAETSDKLDTLKEAERQVIAQFERGEVAEEQVRALQREIIKTENQLEGMRSELTTTNQAIQNFADGTDSAERHTQEYRDSLEGASKELEEFKGKASEAFDTAKTGALALGAGTVAVAGYAVNLSNEFDKALNTLVTQTGASTEEIDGLNEAMENVYKNNFGENMDDVAQSMATIKNTMGDWLDDNGLQILTEDALLLRDTFDFDVNESIRAVNSLMNQFGIDGEQAYSLIAQGAQNGLNQNGDLLDVINEYSNQFAGMGYEAEDMFNMLANGADAGTWSVDKLGDAVKEFNIRASDGTVSDAINENAKAFGLSKKEAEGLSKEIEGGSVEAYQKLLNQLKAVDDDTQRYQLGVAMFGTMWEDLGENAVLSLFDTQGAIKQTTDALDQINAVKYDDIGSALGGLKRSLETDVIDPLGEELKPVVEDVIEYVQENGPQIKDVISKIVKSVGEFIKTVIENKDSIVGAIVAIGAGFVAWNVVTMIQGVVKAIKAFKLANEGATFAQMALNLVMKANPIGLIITAITALVAGFIYLWNTSDKFRAFWINLWEIVSNAVSVAIDGIVSFFSGAWTSITEVWSVATEWFGGIVDSIVGFFSSAWESIVSIWSVVTEWFAGIWAGIVEIFTPAIEWFSTLFTSIYDSIASIITVIVGLLRGTWTIITTIFGIVATWFNTNVIEPVKNAFSIAWSTISNLASGAWNFIKGVWSAVSGWFSSNIIEPVGNWFANMWNKLKSGASDAWSGIKSTFSNVTTWFRTQFTNAWTAVKNVFSTGGKIFSGIKEGIATTFKTVVNGLISGINKVVAVPFNAINKMLNKIRGIEVAGVSPFENLWSKNPLSVPQIPKLWRGGILKKGQTGYLEGDGAEAVVPLEQETGWINRIAQKMNDIQKTDPSNSNAVLTSKMDEMIRTMKKLRVVLDSGALVGELIDPIDEQLGYHYALRERGV